MFGMAAAKNSSNQSYLNTTCTVCTETFCVQQVTQMELFGDLLILLTMCWRNE